MVNLQGQRWHSMVLADVSADRDRYCGRNFQILRTPPRLSALFRVQICEQQEYTHNQIALLIICQKINDARLTLDSDMANFK